MAGGGQTRTNPPATMQQATQGSVLTMSTSLSMTIPGWLTPRSYPMRKAPRAPGSLPERQKPWQPKAHRSNGS